MITDEEKLPEKCTRECPHANQYNEDWIECYHKKMHGNKTQVNTNCKVKMNICFNKEGSRGNITDEELDVLEQNLQNEIVKPENKMVAFGRTRIDLMAEDCLHAIQELRKEKSRRAVPSEEVQRVIEQIDALMIREIETWENADDEWQCEPGAERQYHELLDAYSLAIQALRQMQGWIPVSKEPERLNTYLVWEKDVGTDIAFYSSKGIWHASVGVLYGVTHYMPLPESPKTTKEPPMHIQV